MKKWFLAVCALLAFTAAGRVQADIVDVVVDVSGIAFMDLENDPDNVNLTVDLGAGFTNYRVIGIGWNYTFSTVGASWGNEAVIRFDGAPPAPIYLTASSTGAPVVNENVNSGGVVDLIGLGLDFDTFGQFINLHFFDDFEDNVNAADANISTGTVTLRVDRTAAIPEPSSMALLGVGTLAFGRYVQRRRKLSK